MTKKQIIEDLEEHKNHLWMYYIDMATMDSNENAIKFLDMYYECSIIINYLKENLDD